MNNSLRSLLWAKLISVIDRLLPPHFGVTKEMLKLFISYSHEDTAFVKKLIENLELAIQGLTITIGEFCLKPGDSLIKIFSEIGTSDFLMPVFSKSFAKSDWCNKELSVAIIKEIKKFFKIIPIVIEPMEDVLALMPSGLAEALGDKFICRFDSKPYEDAFRELVLCFVTRHFSARIVRLHRRPGRRKSFSETASRAFQRTKNIRRTIRGARDFS